MRKNFLSFCLSLFVVVFMLAGCQKNNSSRSAANFPVIDLVPEKVARSVAEKFDPGKFFNQKSNPEVKHGYKWTANGNNAIKNQFVFKDSSGYPAFYIFNFANNGGFVMVSADYNMQPVLAFVETGEFKKDTVPPGLIEWVNRTFENTEVVRKGLYDNKRAAKAAWNTYFKENGNTATRVEPEPGCQEYSYNVTVGPLLPVTWGQGCSYNDLCPSKSCTNVCWSSTAAWTGCVATAAAQVVRYWQPSTQYGYNYASMPTGSGDWEVQRLMRDLGLPENVDMDYQCSGSGADGGRVPGALKTRFGMTSANRISYDVGTYQRVQNNLANHWPVLLEGCRSRTNRFLGLIYSYSDCHEWVCDGYSATDIFWCNEDGTGGGAGYLYFHMNWGWHETWGGNDYNGWFGFNNWNISALNWNYQYSRDAVTEIHP